MVEKCGAWDQWVKWVEIEVNIDSGVSQEESNHGDHGRVERWCER